LKKDIFPARGVTVSVPKVGIKLYMWRVKHA